MDLGSATNRLRRKRTNRQGGNRSSPMPYDRRLRTVKDGGDIRYRECSTFFPPGPRQSWKREVVKPAPEKSPSCARSFCGAPVNYSNEVAWTTYDSNGKLLKGVACIPEDRDV